jgi:hypothetical protein
MQKKAARWERSKRREMPFQGRLARRAFGCGNWKEVDSGQWTLTQFREGMKMKTARGMDNGKGHGELGMDGWKLTGWMDEQSRKRKAKMQKKKLGAWKEDGRKVQSGRMGWKLTRKVGRK